MFQGMFRNRGRPPDPLPIGGYEQPPNEESNQIPVHQLMETPRQLPLPPVREFEQDATMQQEPAETSNAFVESSSLQPVSQDDNMLNPQERRLALQSRHVLPTALTSKWESKAISTADILLRKHSPRRYRPGRPFGQFRHFQRKSVYLSFFLAFATSKNAF